MAYGKISKDSKIFHLIYRDRFSIMTLCGNILPQDYRTNRVTKPKTKEMCKLCLRSLHRMKVNKKLAEKDRR